MKSPRRPILGAFFAVAVLLFGAPAAFAQGGVTSTLSGTVTDASGAVISTSTNADNYRVTGVMENSSRIIQLVTRFSW